MQTDRTEDLAWNELTPVLDEALDAINDADREVILLRFFEHKTMADLGQALRITEAAAKMRVSRALERLRAQLSGMGVTCSAVLLGTLLFERSVQAAPATLPTILAAIKVPAAAPLASSLAGLLLAAPKAKLLAGLAAALLVGSAAFFILQRAGSGREPNSASRAGAAALAQQGEASNQTMARAASDAQNTTAADDPDPLKLLEGVMQSRQRIFSGIMEFEVFTRGNVTRPEATNRLQLKIQFEDGRWWAESIGREYRYVTPIPGGPEADRAGSPLPAEWNRCAADGAPYRLKPSGWTAIFSCTGTFQGLLTAA